MKAVKLAANPYTNRMGIHCPDDFFGRSHELEDIYTRIQGCQSVSLVGERRIGKSSILNALRFERDEFGLPREFDFILIDMQSNPDFTEKEFIEYLLNQISEVTGLSAPVSKRMPLITIAEEVQRRGRRLVIMIDEFDVLVHNEGISMQLFSIFRSMAAQFRICFVIASREGSIDHLAEDEKTGSAFLNIFGPIYVGPFQEEEAIDLIHIPAESRGILFTEEDEKTVLDLAGFFPLFLQIACYHLFSLKQSETPEEEARLILEKKFAFESKPHFDYMLSRMPEGEQRELASWIRNGYTTDESARAKLIDKGIMIQTRKKTRIFSKAFAEMVSSQSAAGNQLRDAVQRYF